MSEQKYYVLLKNLTGQPTPIQLCRFGFCGELVDFAKPKLARGNYLLKGPTQRFTKSELGKIMGGVFYRTFTHQFDPELAEELYKLGYKTTQTTEEWIGARYEFDNIWEWINPLIELVSVDEVEK